jgi:hypothetical protein
MNVTQSNTPAGHVTLRSHGVHHWLKRRTTYSLMDTKFLDQMARQLKQGKLPECRRAVERKLERVRKQYEDGGYDNQGAALKDLRDFVDAEPACQAKH